MPCYRCGVRQTDPDRGQSPWKRGVRSDSQILICPTCQASHDWMADLDRCSQCSSVHLVRRLGEVECRDCGAIVPPAIDDLAGSGLGNSGSLGGAGSPGGAGSLGGAGVPDRAGLSPGLSEEVAKALERVLGRSPVSQSVQSAHGTEPARSAEPEAAARPPAVTR
jgi:hypothetical protein